MKTKINYSEDFILLISQYLKENTNIWFWSVVSI